MERTRRGILSMLPAVSSRRLSRDGVLSRYTINTKASLAAIAVLAIIVFLASCSSDGEWHVLPDSPLSARAYAATGCVDDGMIVWGGALPGGGATNEVLEGSAVYESDTWREVKDPPLAARMRAGTDGNPSGAVMVWGGHGGTVASEDPNDFVYFADGALYDAATSAWRLLPPGPLEPRADPQVVAVGTSTFVVAGGDAAPGPDVDRNEQAAIYDAEANAWTRLAPPPPESVIVDADGLVAFSRDGMYRFEITADVWILEMEYPAGVARPDHVAASEGRIVGATGSSVWILDGDFVALPSALVEQVDVVGWIGPDIVAWGYEERAAAIYEPATGQWQLSDAPSTIGTRLGSSVCVTDTEMILWGGWIHRDPHLQATDDGAAFSPATSSHR